MMTMQTFMVGGAVRDGLLGLAVKDRDWVVVGSSAEELLAAGFTQVGADFPVFLHPVTREEHALARTERKTAPGYRGFVVHADSSVTLEDDLRRRDLTINAIAQHEDGTLVDPHGGVADLRGGVLRHVSDSFREDPVRVLRLARFAARFTSFTVAPETMALLREMVRSGEVDALVSERVWQELAKGLMESRPSRMLDVLQECGALGRVLPDVARLVGVPQPLEHHPEGCTFEHVKLVLDHAASMGASLGVRYACLVHDLGKGVTPADQLPRHLGHEASSQDLARVLGFQLGVPAELQSLGMLVAGEHGNVHMSMKLNGAAVLRLLERCDAFRRPDRFAEAMVACECDARGRLGLSDRPYPQRARLMRALDLCRGVDAKQIAKRMLDLGRGGEHIGQAIHAERARVLKQSLDEQTAAT